MIENNTEDKLIDKSFDSNLPSRPTSRYWTWKSDKNDPHFTSWDKVNKENIAVKSLKFCILAKTASVIGYAKDLQCYVYSNFFTDTKTQKVTIRSKDKNAIILQGDSYEELKPKVKQLGLKYGNNLWIMNLDTREIEHLEISGAILKQAMEKNIELFPGKAFEFGREFTVERNGAIEYAVPSLEKTAIYESEYNYALYTHRSIVDEYIAAYLGKNATTEGNADYNGRDTSVIDDEELEDLPLPPIEVPEELPKFQETSQKYSSNLDIDMDDMNINDIE